MTPLEFIWKYLLGPVIADARNAKTAAWHGVTAHTGYNIINTATWGIIAVAAIFIVRRELGKRDIQITTTTAISAIPFIALGGVLRFLEDAAVAPFIVRPLIITPFIYFLIAAVFLTALAVASRLAPRYGYTRDKILQAIGYAALTPFLVFSLYLVLTGKRPYALIPPIAISTVLTVIYYSATRKTGYGSKEYVLVAFSQFFGAAASMVSLSYGYHQKQLLTQAFTSIFGQPGILVLKAGIAGLAIYIIEEDLEEETFKAIALIVLYSIGIATGLRVLLRLAAGI
ncbi:MAG: DUF63 family protein [Candidatus Nanohalobium sp.]